MRKKSKYQRLCEAIKRLADVPVCCKHMTKDQLGKYILAWGTVNFLMLPTSRWLSITKPKRTTGTKGRK